MNNREFVSKLKEVATNYKTVYVMGCFGDYIKSSNVKRYTTNYDYNKKPERTEKIKASANKTPPVFGFDCVCLIKGILWGWNGDASKSYGGAVYESNGVPDINEDSMIKKCSDLSTDFSNIDVGEAVWMPGHIGVYIGDGLAVECTPMWKDGVQITACNCSKNGYNRRDWVKHGKLPYIEYEVKKEEKMSDKDFLPKRGYFKKGDSGENVEKINLYWNKMFPGFANKLNRNLNDVLGSYFGENTEAWVKEFQRLTRLEQDGCIGPITLAEMKLYGFDS